MKFLESLLYQASTVLLLPVMLCIVVCGLWLIFQTGQTLRLYRLRRSRSFEAGTFFRQQVELIFASKPDYELAAIEVVQFLREWEMQQHRSLKMLRLTIKAGPTLGLMGTLIPMGTALASLSQGDMMVMSVNMVTAFTTTIIGLACGLVAYVLAMVRQNWFVSDRLHGEVLGEKALLNLKMHGHEQGANYSGMNQSQYN